MLHSLTILLLMLSAVVTRAAEPQLDVDSEPDSHAHGQIALEPDAALSLREVLIQTIDREPGRLALAARWDEAVALDRNARSLLSSAPTISANHGTDGLFSDDGYRRWDVGLRLPVWWPGQRTGRRKTARAAESAASHAQRAHALEVAGWVRQAISNLALSRVRLELTKAEWRAENELAAQIERAVALGELANRELLLARSASLDRRLLYLEALEESRHAEGTYYLLTGLGEWPADWRETPADSEALENHPLLLLAGEEVARAQGELDQLSADQWGHPILAIGSEHERDSSGENFDDRIIAGVSIPLGRRRNARVEVAAARRALAEERRDRQRLERRLHGRLTEAEHSFALSSQRVSTAAEQSEMAAEYLRLTELGFGLGETDLRQLLGARSRATAAKQSHREAVILRQSSAAEINQALGVLP